MRFPLLQPANQAPRVRRPNEPHPNQEHHCPNVNRRHGNVGRPFRWGRARPRPFRGGQRNNPPRLQLSLTPLEIEECIGRGLNWEYLITLLCQ